MMNIIEKRKVESVILAEISEAKEKLKEQRGNEFEVLKSKFELHTPPAILAMAKKILALRKQADETEREMKNNKGWELADEYGDDKSQLVKLCSKRIWSGRNGNDSYEQYSFIDLTNHQKETADKERALDMLVRKFTLKIYAEGQEMEKVWNAFQQELSKVLA